MMMSLSVGHPSIVSPSDQFTSRLRTHSGPVTCHALVTHVTKHTQGKLFRKWVDVDSLAS